MENKQKKMLFLLKFNFEMPGFVKMCLSDNVGTCHNGKLCMNCKPNNAICSLKLLNKNEQDSMLLNMFWNICLILIVFFHWENLEDIFIALLKPK